MRGRGERQLNVTHVSASDGNARLFREGDGRSSRLCYMGHLLMENRDALIVDASLTWVFGASEREAVLAMPGRRKSHAVPPITRTNPPNRSKWRVFQPPPNGG